MIIFFYNIIRLIFLNDQVIVLMLLYFFNVLLFLNEVFILLFYIQ
jgi:hypothetical protein